MKTRHLFLYTVLAILGLFALSPPASSAGYPDRPIQLIIPYVAGSTGDITSRIVAEELEKILGTKIVANNKPGASTVLGVETFLRTKKDGYTLFYGGATPFIYVPIANPQVVN